jgi:peptide/nickel transport system substrate-binding protein
MIFKVLPDRNTVIAQAKTGDIDLGIDYTEAQIPEMSKVPNVSLIITHPPVYERYHFTMVTRDDITKPHPILGDIRVRRALVLATDRQTVINTVLYGKTKIAKNELDNTSYENAGIHPLPFSLSQARALLDEAGWKPGADGIRVKDGTRLSLTFSTTAGNQTRETIEALVQANWKNVGVEMTIHDEPASNFFGSFVEGGGWLARKYDIVGFTNGLSSVDPNLRPFWHSSEIPTKDKPNGVNSSGLSDPKLDALLDAQLKEFDPVKRKQLLDQAQMLIHTDLPMIPMYDRSIINTVNRRAHGVNPTDFGGITGVMWNTNEWWVE